MADRVLLRYFRNQTREHPLRYLATDGWIMVYSRSLNQMKRQDLRHIIKDRILLLDGAMGTMIQRYGLEEKDFRGGEFSGHPKNSTVQRPSL
ncbi:MAG: hypothetical protein MZU84_06650 [Sphingobacterium sp.]|nr:hypothetical protein [Sphingobacterium sp.]